MTVVRVLVVDDSALMRKALRTMLVDAPGPVRFEVTTARNGVDALDRVRAERPDVVTLDVNMPEMDGLTCLAQLMATDPVPVVMVSSLTEAGARVTLEALELGAVDHVAKPGGTVSLDIEDVADELITKVTRAARARVRPAAPRADAVPAPGRAAASGAAAPVGRRPVDVVLVGVSTGGPKALKTLLTGLPAGFGAPIVVAQHIAESFAGHLAARLDAACALPVRPLTAPVDLVAGEVYLAGGDRDVVLARGRSGLVAKPVPASASFRWHPSVDRLASSALRVVGGERVLAVLLTGMGDDGAHGFAELSAAGARVIAESADTCVVHGMPAELVRLGGASVELPLQEITPRILQWV